MKLNKCIKSFKYAFSGLFYLVKTQKNARIHLAATVLVCVFAAWLKLPILSWSILLIVIALVWFAELINTSFEEFFDLVELEESVIVKNGKDLSAAAVLVTALLSVVVGILLLGPPLLEKISSWFLSN